MKNEEEKDGSKLQILDMTFEPAPSELSKCTLSFKPYHTSGSSWGGGGGVLLLTPQ